MTHTKDEALKAAYLSGFNASGEGYNGEYPFGDKAQDPEEDAAWCKYRDESIAAIKQASALDKKAENARELGLDYEPADGTQVSKVWWDGEKLMAKPIPLVDFYQPVQDSTCSETLRAQGKAYPRTCRKCGKGPCIGAPKPPPAQPAPVQEPVAVIGSDFQLLYCREDWAKGLKVGDTLCLCTPPAAQRQWVGLTDEEMYLNCPNWLSQEQCKVWVAQIETKLKEKNT